MLENTGSSLQGQQLATRDEARQPTGSLAIPSLLQVWHVVLRWKWVIATIIILSVVAGLGVTLLTTPQYAAVARVEISREQKNVTNVQGVDSEQVGRDQEFYQTQYELLGARSLAERVVKRLKLDERPDFFEYSGVSPDSETLFFGNRQKGLTEQQKRKRFDLATSTLLNNVGIHPIFRSSLVDVSYTSASAELSALIANEWTQQFIAASIDRRFASTSDARRFLETRLSDLRARLEQSERDLVTYAGQKAIVALGASTDRDGKTQPGRTLVETDLETLNRALVDATASRIAAESRLGGGSNGASSEALGNTAISNLRQKRAEVAAEYAKLLVQFEPGYPPAQALQGQISELDRAIGREESRVRSGVSDEYSNALKREQTLRVQVEAIKKQFATQRGDSIQYNIYQREADTNRLLYDGLLQRYKEIGVAGVSANNVSIVDTAKAPEKPSAPSLPTNLALALFVGLILAAGATFALEQIDEGLREPSQVSRILQIPLLGSIPDVGEEDMLAKMADAKSEVSEAYLSVRSNLAFSTDHGMPASFMVTSTRPAEGKSVSSVALARVLGRTGKRVVLIDADMRAPSMHTYLGLSNNAGLSNYLSGNDDYSKLLLTADIDGVTLMPAGPTPPSAAELLSSDRMTLLLARLREDFDHIVIDAPPILGLADAPLLSRAVEGTVFVIEAEGVAVRGVKASLGRIQAVQGHIFGAILTKLKQRQAGYGYGYGSDDTKDA